MRINRDRVIALCNLAMQGARGDAERQFVTGMVEGYQDAWREQDAQVEARDRKLVEAEIESRIKAERESVIAGLDALKTDEKRSGEKIYSEDGEISGKPSAPIVAVNGKK